MFVSRLLVLLCFVAISPVLSAPILRLRGAVIHPRHPVSKEHLGYTVTNLKKLNSLALDNTHKITTQNRDVLPVNYDESRNVVDPRELDSAAHPGEVGASDGGPPWN